MRFNFSARLQKVRSLLKTLGLESLLIDHPTDIFYLTGEKISAGRLIITQKDAVFIIDARYIEQCASQSLYPTLLRQENTLLTWLKEREVHSLGFDQQQTTFAAYAALKTMAEGHPLELIPLDAPLMVLRFIKDGDEINALRAAARLGLKGFSFAEGLLKEGVAEEEIALELEMFWRRQGASGLAFPPTVAFGKNGSMPHYRAGNTRLELNTAVMIDAGVILSHYCSDHTRMFFFGEPPPLVRDICHIVRQAQEKAISLCRPGVTVRELDTSARDLIKAAGYGDHFTHSLGHGLGLDVHEFPVIRSYGPTADIALQAGMVITIEPGIYLPGIGGARLEEMVLITDDGCEVLYTDS